MVRASRAEARARTGMVKENWLILWYQRLLSWSETIVFAPLSARIKAKYVGVHSMSWKCQFKNSNFTTFEQQHTGLRQALADIVSDISYCACIRYILPTATVEAVASR